MPPYPFFWRGTPPEHANVAMTQCPCCLLVHSPYIMRDPPVIFFFYLSTPLAAARGIAAGQASAAAHHHLPSARGLAASGPAGQAATIPAAVCPGLLFLLPLPSPSRLRPLGRTCSFRSLAPACRPAAVRARRESSTPSAPATTKSPTRSTA